jgi:hypothetical protein
LEIQSLRSPLAKEQVTFTDSCELVVGIGTVQVAMDPVGEADDADWAFGRAQK